MSSILLLPNTAELLRLLKHCGWVCTSGERQRGEIVFRTFQGEHIAPYARCRAGGAELILITMEEVHLPESQDLLQKILKLSLETRMALVAAAALGAQAGMTAPEWLLLRTSGCVELYHLPTERCELRACLPHEWEEELMPALSGLAHGRRENAWTQTSPGAEPLREWLRQWSTQLRVAMELPRDAAERMLWRWILMLQAVRRSDGHEAVEKDGAVQWGLSARNEQERLTIAYDAVNTSDELARQLELFPLQFVTSIFPEDTEELATKLRALDDTTLLDRFRAELLMLAQGTFAPETVAWLFTDLAREQEGWRRELAGIEPVRKRLMMDGWHVFEPLECNIGRHGLAAALRDSERLAEHLNMLQEFQKQWGRRAEGIAATQPDLFQPLPRGVTATGILADPINFLFGEALRLAVVPTVERFGVGVTFLLHAMNIAQRLGWPWLGVDTLDRSFAQIETN